MPKPGSKVARSQPKVTAKGLAWEVEQPIETCEYRLGKLLLHKSVVGEITLLKTEFPRVSSVMSQLGIRVVES